MKIKFITRTDERREELDYYDAVEIHMDGKKVFHVQDDVVEDANLFRSFEDVYKILNLLGMTYDAGKNGEEFEVERIESDEI